MANNYFTQTVEIMCKTLRKMPCISKAKKCAKILLNVISSAKLQFPTNFSNIVHQLFHKSTTSDDQLFYPLFHTPYNNNY